MAPTRLAPARPAPARSGRPVVPGRAPTRYGRGGRPLRRRRPGPARLAALGLAVAAAVVVVPAVRDAVGGCDQDPALPAAAVDAAARIGVDAGLRVGVAVVDTATGACLVAGDQDGEFATASVVKVMVAARLLTEGALTGETEALARAMVSLSDDAAANVLWERAGGPDLEPWIEEHYDLPELGSPNGITGRWGNTHVTPLGLARLYAALRADPVVWPWLGAALHDVRARAADGTDQGFGLQSVAPGAAVKQGWANGSADDAGDAVVNSTGLLAGDRYVVVLLTEGDGNVSGCDGRGFHAGQAAVVTAMAQQLVPSLAG
ncbi:serine hydrolase [Geodermatophilus nigrescens]|uniref:Beta-lactamase enzyme family protein n=1 Tax=Geodermatophilus nigrescens TaxID=1070870 RepID=A0A1M5CQ34_9ACTN|nr:serine hydrolase [Geodermatophilus nigrescens]SHF56855.1 Beta-lactamase enzyme family protein [Geodermatophilus nigrescens]